MKKFLKFLTGLALLPFCWAASHGLYALLSTSRGAAAGAQLWALPAGFLAAVLGFFLLPRPFRTYVLAHELTHAVWGLLMGARVGRMKVGSAGGHVELSKSNFLITLAPYFFPLYTGLVIVAWCIAGLFRDMSPWEPWWLGAVGLTWGFHVTFTVLMLSQHQPDIKEHGRLFSYAVIYLANLFCAALWIILIGSPKLAEAGQVFSAETAAAYRTAWQWILCAKAWVQSARAGQNL